MKKTKTKRASITDLLADPQFRAAVRLGLAQQLHEFMEKFREITRVLAEATIKTQKEITNAPRLNDPLVDAMLNTKNFRESRSNQPARRSLSRAAREKIAKAQRARWRAFRSGKKAKKNPDHRVKRDRLAQKKHVIGKHR